MKKNVVIVTVNPQTNAIFTQQFNADNTPKLDKNGKPFGYIRLSQPRFNLGAAYLNGGVSDVSTLRAMPVEVWNKVKGFYTPNMEINGNIRVMETIDENIHKNGVGTGYKIKRAGKDGEILTKGGLPIYAKTEYTLEENVLDVRVQHDNVIVAQPGAKKALNETASA